jgi:hypothetical protein
VCRIGFANTVVAVALIAIIIITTIGGLARRILIIGIAYAACTRLVTVTTVTVAILRSGAVTSVVVSTSRVSTTATAITIFNALVRVGAGWLLSMRCTVALR